MKSRYDFIDDSTFGDTMSSHDGLESRLRFPQRNLTAMRGGDIELRPHFSDGLSAIGQSEPQLNDSPFELKEIVEQLPG